MLKHGEQSCTCYHRFSTSKSSCGKHQQPFFVVDLLIKSIKDNEIALQNLQTPNAPLPIPPLVQTSARVNNQPTNVNSQAPITSNPVPIISTAQPQQQPPTPISTSQPSNPTPNHPQNHLPQPSPLISGSSTTSRPPKPIITTLRNSLFTIRTDLWNLIHELLTRIPSLLHALSTHLPLLLSTLLFLLTCYLTLSSITSNTTSPLLRLSPQLGTFLLSVLSKLTDYGFQAVASSVREKVQWGVLIQKGGNMLGFLTMGASVSGWRKVLLRKRGRGLTAILGRGSRRAWYENPRVLSLVK
jgi:hypothetical protein